VKKIVGWLPVIPRGEFAERNGLGYSEGWGRECPQNTRRLKIETKYTLNVVTKYEKLGCYGGGLNYDLHKREEGKRGGRSASIKV